MTLTEAWKEFGCKYAGPNLEEKFKQLMREYAQEKCEEMRETCASSLNFDFESLNNGDDAYDSIMETGLPDFE